METLGISEDVYERLEDRKRDDESITDVIEGLLEDAEPAGARGSARSRSRKPTTWNESFARLVTAVSEISRWNRKTPERHRLLAVRLGRS